jgi:uncharacterized protein (TIGR02300 family)
MGPQPHRPFARRLGSPIVKVRPTLARFSLEFAFDSLDRSWQLASPFGRAELFLGVCGVAKPEWGSKRICLNCGARFYDLNREPIVCPACSTVLDPVAQNRPRRSRAAAPKLAAVAAVADPEEAVAVAPDEEVEIDGDDEGEEAVAVAAKDEEESEEEEEAEDDGESAIEDVSELGDDDMTDVIETDLDEEESER